MTSKKKSVNATQKVDVEEPLDVESSLLDALEDIPKNPVFFKVDGQVHKLPFQDNNPLLDHADIIN